MKRGSLLVIAGLLLLAQQATAAIKPGDILVADQDGPDGDGALIRVDPDTGQQVAISTNAISTTDLLDGANGVATTRNGQILVGNYGAAGAGSVIRVDPKTGEQTVVSSNAISTLHLFADPFHLALDPTGAILAADGEAFTAGTGAVIEADPATGQQKFVSNNGLSTGDLFEDPWGIVVERSGSLLVSDYTSPPGSGAVIRVDRATAQQTAVVNNDTSSTDLFAGPIALASEGPGSVLVVDFSSDAVVRGNLATGQQTLVAHGTSTLDLFGTPVAVALDAKGTILVADQNSNVITGAVIKADPATGELTTVSNNALSDQDLFENPSAIAVVPPRCFGQFPALVQLGTPGADTLRGTSRADVIVGLGGRDKLVGLGGADRLCGLQGRDRLLGGKGKDRLAGGSGRDRLLGGKGRDRLRGGPGRDIQRQ